MASPKIWTRLNLGWELITSNGGKRVESPELLGQLQNKAMIDWMSIHNVKLADFDWLIVRNLDVSNGQVIIENNGRGIYHVGVMYDVRYRMPQSYGYVFNRSGTLTAQTVFRVVVDRTAGGEVSVIIHQLDDSNGYERFFRKHTDALTRFNQLFVRAVSVQLIEWEFSNPDRVKELLGAAKFPANEGPRLP